MTRPTFTTIIGDGPNDSTGYITCEQCGCAWFELRRDNKGKPGALVFDHDGHVVAYSGRRFCTTCGHPYGEALNQPDLRLMGKR